MLRMVTSWEVWHSSEQVILLAAIAFLQTGQWMCWTMRSAISGHRSHGGARPYLRFWPSLDIRVAPILAR